MRSKRKRFKLGYGKIPGYTAEPEYARQQGVTLATQRRRRRLGQTGPYIRVGRQIHYQDEGSRRLFESKLIYPASQQPSV